MNDLRTIQLTLRRAVRRRRADGALRGLWHGLLFGAIASLLLAAAYRLFPLPEAVLCWVALMPLIGSFTGLVLGGARSPGLMETARWLDEHQHLQERLSTALETTRAASSIPTEAGNTWRDLLLRDAANSAAKLDPKTAISFRIAKTGRWAAIVLLVTAVLGFVPEYRSKAYQQARRDAENIRETGRRIAELTRRELEKRPPRLETTRTALEATTTLGERLSARPPTRDETLRELASAAERLRQAAAEISRSPVARQLQQAARSTGDSLRSPAALQKEIDALKERIGGASATPEQLRQMQNRLKMAEQTARAMSGANASASDLKEKLGAGLSELSAQAQGLGIDLPKLEEAIQALAANEPGLFLKNLEASLADLEKLAQMARALEAMQQQAGKLGKDLAEQLAKGQAEAAKETLERLAAKLQSGQLSPAEMKDVLKEVAKAIDPAGNYGEVSKHLQAAADRMIQDKQTGAGKSLQDAAKELESLMQQVGEAQTAQAAMEALQQASMAIGTGQLWAPGRMRGNRPGTMPGPGVGTWNDAQRTWDGTVAEMPDNSGIRRPDSDSRSDLAEPEPGPALTPTKVRGQFSPGGQMPSISLRGVGIKGQSKVAYEEAATAAQIEAESALGQNKVPRAYRESVKNYFDDLKK